MIEKIKNSGLIWLWLTVIVFVLDQWTKSWASNTLNLYQAEPITSFLNWTLMHNEGMAFSILADQSGWQRWAISVVAIGIVFWLLHWLYNTDKDKKILNIGLVLVVGGALGNTFDRLTLGYVVDFIEIFYKTFYWPAFNIADMAISCGAILLIIDMIFEKDDSN